ncbi:acyl-CoA thioesterase domain-containing protein [Nocardioides sp. AE5]|uniref:acyl-CoA thioesterase domain-containing protein n=1 Tax=Nocardioides sp. AE5 TaxID=2962573 RepID=UPI0028822F50|nr:acyl-CoA thioesterase domain-containing protein [Nocardioides sp. AE5]MDT0200657.1 thioesterase family protein [Nocardioides sp. AE5]
MPLAFFVRDGETFVPRELAQSLWSDKQMHGVAVSGLLAWGAERLQHELGLADLVPAKFSVDMFRPAAMGPTNVEARVVRKGSRILLVDALLVQDGETVARAAATFLKPGGVSHGEAWSPTERPSPPPLEIAPVGDAPHVPFFHSEAGWSQDFTEHQNPSRKTTWQTGVPIIDGEPNSRFTSAASVADATSMVANWGSKGVEFINSDITLYLARLPEGVQVGISALDRVEHDGLVVGTATVFDRSGPIGTTVLTGLANAKRTVDFESIGYLDNGERATSPGV